MNDWTFKRVIFRLEGSGDPQFVDTRSITLCGANGSGHKLAGGNFITIRVLSGVRMIALPHASIRSNIPLPVSQLEAKPIIHKEE